MNAFNIVMLVLHSIFIIITIACLILCFWKRNKQPLKSRGPIPFVVIVALFAISASKILLHAGVPSEAVCIIELFETSPLLLMILYVAEYQCFRYFTLTNINKHKQHLALYHVYKEQLKREKKKQQETEQAKSTPGSPTNEEAPPLTLKVLSPAEVQKILKYKFQHFMLSRLLKPWVVVSGAILYYFWYAGGSGIIWIVSWVSTGKSSCPIYTLFPAVTFWYSLNVFILVMVALFVIILDIIANWKLVRKCAIRKLFLDKDPFLFRAEYGKSLVILLWALVSFTGLATADTVATSQFQFVSPEIQMLIGEINSMIVQSALLWNNVLFVLIITFNWERNGKTGFEQSYISEVCQVLDNPELSLKFKKFAEREFSVENYLCYQDIQKYNGLKTKEERKQLAETIYSTYFKTNALLDVNVDQKLRETIRNQINDGILDDSLFKDARSAILLNLSDTYSRFKDLPSFKTYQKNAQISKEILMKNL